MARRRPMHRAPNDALILLGFTSRLSNLARLLPDLEAYYCLLSSLCARVETVAGSAGFGVGNWGPPRCASMTRPRLLITVPRFPPHIGGSELYAQRIAHGLAERGWPVWVVTTEEPGARNLDIDRGIVVERLPARLTVSNTPLDVRWYPRMLVRIRLWEPDIVIAHAPVPGLAEVTAAAAGGRPFVLTYHAGSMAKGVRGVDTILRCYERGVLPQLLRRATAVITTSPQFRDDHVGRRGLELMRLIPPGVNVEQFRPAEGTSSRAKVLYVGRLDRTSRWKGVLNLVAAAAGISRAVPRASVEIVGGGNDLAHLRGYAERSGVGDVVNFRGPLRGAELVAAYQEATVAVLPSLTESEAFGMSMLEASACGVPTVASRVGGIPSVVRHGETGLLVPPGDSTALASAIVRILSDDALAATLGAAGRRMACNEFTWERQISETESLLEEVWARRSPSSAAREMHGSPSDHRP